MTAEKKISSKNNKNKKLSGIDRKLCIKLPWATGKQPKKKFEANKDKFRRLWAWARLEFQLRIRIRL